MPLYRLWPTLALVAATLLVVLALPPKLLTAQSPLSLDDQTLLSLILPPLPDGSRPGVHMWARADQFDGPGGLPTVFVVTLYTDYSGGSAQEREIVNYLQPSSGGAWVPARPRDPGTLLTEDWAWISLNLQNLTATASGSGDASQYTVDYTASGTYSGSPRLLQLEEVYGADLSLRSSTVLSDTSGIATVPAPSAGSGNAQPAAPLATPAASSNTVSGPAAPPPAPPVAAAASATPSTSNIIRPASPTP